MVGYIEPAAVCGEMTDAQTEARAIAQKLQDVVDGTDGWLNVDKAAGIIATALEAQAAELATLREADGNFWEAIARAERAEAQLAEARKALANYDRWLNGRDAYIVQKGLWQNFVASLPGSPTARRVLEAQGGE